MELKENSVLRVVGKPKTGKTTFGKQLHDAGICTYVDASLFKLAGIVEDLKRRPPVLQIVFVDNLEHGRSELETMIRREFPNVKVIIFTSTEGANPRAKKPAVATA